MATDYSLEEVEKEVEELESGHATSWTATQELNYVRNLLNSLKHGKASIAPPDAVKALRVRVEAQIERATEKMRRDQPAPPNVLAATEIRP